MDRDNFNNSFFILLVLILVYQYLKGAAIGIISLISKYPSLYFSLELQMRLGILLLMRLQVLP